MLADPDQMNVSCAIKSSMDNHTEIMTMKMESIAVGFAEIAT